jgi:hypothetical protein
MASQSAAFAGVPHDQSALGWLVAIPLGGLLLIQALLALTGAVPVLDGTLGDADAYMRLSRVLELHDSGNWFDSRFPRINPPDGHVQHWTRPLDALLFAGAWLLQPFLGFGPALHLWGVLISPACLALTVVALDWAARPVLARSEGMLACLTLLLQPTVLAYSSLGRPDHHAPLLLLFVVLLGLTLRLFADPHGRRLAEAAGLVAALAIWLSPEALAFLAPSLASVGLVWLLGEAAMAAAIRRYLVALTLALATALLVERGTDGFWASENDRLSLIHLSLFGGLALVWTLIAAAERRRLAWGGALQAWWGAPLDSGHPRSAAWPALIGRAGVAAGGTLGVGLALIALFPELRAGPLGQVDPLYAEVRLHRILEIQPLLSAGWLDRELGPQLHRVFRLIGLAWLAVPFLVFLLIREHGDQRKKMWACIALTLATLLALTFYQVRWAIYTQALLVLPYSALLGSLLRRAAVRVSPRAVPFCRTPLIVAGLLWPLLPALLLPRANVEIAGQSCPIARIAPALERAVGPAPRTIMAFADFGPEILYRTGYSVLSIPNHRPQPGFAATYRALTARADADARAILEDYRVDLILLCPSEVERSIFTPPDGGSGHLYERVVDGTPPGWLREVTLEAEEGPALNARILQVLPGPTLVQRSAGARF